MTYRAWTLKQFDRAALKDLTAAIAEQNTEELEMNAMDDEPWSEQKYAATLAAQQKEVGLLAGILAARGITDPTEALTLLAGEEELSDPMLLTDMDKACARILEAIDKEQTIVVYGDYDVDGVTATALLYQHLKGMGASVKCMLPSREGDGYGLSKNAIQSIHDKGCQLIVTVDNGISALEEAEFAASLGVDLIVTDHHLPHDALPKAVAVVDPRRADDHSPFKGLCGAGVAFKLCAALDGCPPEEMLDYCGDLAAVGTVADVMPLTGENRTLVKAGLKLLQQTDRPGISALLEEVGLEGKPITAENVSYAIAPRINAAGRMDNAVTALQLVLCTLSPPSSKTGSSSSGGGTGTPASSASWPRAWWKRPAAPSSWCPWTNTARARAAAAACRASTCTSASPPVRTSCSASAATPWRRAFRCGRKIYPNCAAA